MTATFETTQVKSWIGRDALGADGDKIGRIESIYEDDDGSGPEWFAISTGWFGSKVSFAPVRGSTAEGDHIRLQWDKDVVKDAPRCDADGHLSRQDEDRLYAHYGMEWAGNDTRPQAAGRATRGTTAGRATRGDTSPDEAMTRSEEELDVSKRQHEVGHARLRKWVETEDVNVTVPVRREVARVVTEPITDDNRGRAMDGPEITEGEHDIVLREEEIDVEKRTVPKERVRLEKDVVEEERTVSGEVRKERIEVDDPSSTERRRGR